MIEQTFNMEIGSFYCPMRSAISPKVDDLARRSREWLSQFGVCTDERQLRRMMATSSAELVGRTLPDGIEDRLQILADWCYWAFAFDDVWSYDSQAMERSEDLIQWVARTMRMLDTLDVRLCGGNPYMIALHDVARRLSRCATPLQMRRWVDGHLWWHFGMVQRQSLHVRDEMPGLDAYVTMRMHDEAGPAVTPFIEIVNGVEVPSHEMDSRPIRALTELTWMISGLDNERVSRAKEIHQGEGPLYHLVDVLMHERGCSPEQALRDAIAMRDRMMCLFLSLRDQSAPQASPALLRYITDLGNLISGNIEWGFTNGRYTTVYDSKALPTGIVSFSGERTLEPADDLLEPLPIPSIAWWWGQLA
jgi:hypothetical protein